MKGGAKMDVLNPRLRYVIPVFGILLAAEIGNVLFLDSLLDSGGELMIHFGFVWGYLAPEALSLVWIPDVAFCLEILVFLFLFFGRFLFRDREKRTGLGILAMWLLPVLLLDVADVLFENLAGQWGNFWYVPRIEFFDWVRLRGTKILRIPDLSNLALVGCGIWLFLRFWKERKNDRIPRS